MQKFYTSKFYKNPIEVNNIKGEIIVTITTELGEKIIYSWYDVIEKQSLSEYINKSLLGSFINKIPKKVLVLGLGGGSFVKFLEEHIEGVEIYGVDIDESMIKISKEIMKVKTNNLFLSDAEEFVNKLISENNINFDSILIDCYGGNSKIPEHLLLQPFFYKCSQVLSEKGIISINMANFEQEEYTYKKMHKNIISQLNNKNYNLLLSNRNELF
ncbi:MAG: methyltransferase domain-containing protein [Candidatus Gracilibacteria bacterium]|nr:methyltransferase domain-containing protein [Candidatus Gracilibacteria bacterium]